jgi:hypothetical protein
MNTLRKQDLDDFMTVHDASNFDLLPEGVRFYVNVQGRKFLTEIDISEDMAFFMVCEAREFVVVYNSRKGDAVLVTTIV